jgi:drug/metabolite transporter (DMT)-like permease
MHHKNLSRAQLLGSMLIFGSIPVFVKAIPLPSAELALWRAALAILVIGLLLIVTKTNPVRGVNRKDLLFLLLSGAAMGFNWILLFEAYHYTTTSVATLAYYFAPVLVTLLCPFLFREKTSAKQILCFVGSTLGLVLIVGVSVTGGGNHPIGILLGLCAALLYATVILFNKAIRSASGIPRTFLQFCAAALVLAPYVALTEGFSIGQIDLKGLAFLLAVGIIHSGVAYCMYFSALRHMPGQEAALLSYIDPLTAVILSVCFLQEPITPWQIVGGVLILGFSIFNEIEFKKKEAAPSLPCIKD